MKLLAIDIGGTYIKYGIVNDHKINDTNKVLTPHDSKESVLKVLQEIYLENKDKQIEGIAISAPGLVDDSYGIAKITGRMSFLQGFHIVEELSKICDDLPVSIENDGKACALCESTEGAAKDVDNSVVLLFGTGIGGGIVLNNQLLKGNNLFAGEFSLLFSNYQRDSYDILGDVYSTIWVLDKVKAVLHDETIDGEKMMEMYQKNPNVTEILDDWFFAIAKICMNIDYLYNPDVICIGGGISSNPLFLQEIDHNLDIILENCFHFRKPVIKKCQFDNDSNLLGACAAFMKKYESKNR